MTATAVTLQRRKTTPFVPTLLARHADFWPILTHAERFFGEPDWPEVSSYARVFDGPERATPPVQFEEMAPRPRRARKRQEPVDPREMYDGRIVRGVVPTRARCWHDFANALVWGSFPLAKQAVHARQHRAICAWIAPGSRQLPGARTREMDALALIDEGGVVRVGARAVVFGHALYEGAALLFHEQGGGPSELQPRRVIAREVLELPELPGESDDTLRARVDRELAAFVEHTLTLEPSSFPRAQSLFCGEGALER